MDMENFDKLIQEKKLMQPLWIAVPSCAEYSAEWRMGPVEGRGDCFREWYSELSLKDQKRYQKLFPAPIAWLDFWREDLIDSIFYEHNRFVIDRWKLTKSTKYSSRWLKKQLSEGVMLKIVTFDNDPDEEKKALAWEEYGFCATAGIPECDFWYVMEFYLTCLEQYFDDPELSSIIDDFYNASLEWSEAKEKISRFTDKEWEKLLPEIFALGFYFQLAQNEEYRNQVLKDFPADTVAVCLDENDTLLGAKITDSGELVGKNIIGFALMNALAEIRKIYANVHLCENAEY